MAELICLHAKEETERFCRANPFLHLYALGDLDDFFWPHTTWYALRERGQVRQLVLLYTGQPMPTVLALAVEPIDQMLELLRQLKAVLPRRFYAHLTDGLANSIADDYRVQSHGLHHKMGLIDPVRLTSFDNTDAIALTTDDVQNVLELYAASYPGNWFMPRMLETGFYYGIRRESALLCVAGVHAYSQHYKVAALGNITTRPDVRGRGLAAKVTAKLCQELLRAGIEYVGLNVKADNHHAIACYKKLGFEHVADYVEYTIEAK